MRRVRWSQTPVVLAAVLVVAAAMGLGGCSQTTRITKAQPLAAPMPVANTPTGLVELFRWCWVNRSIEPYRGLFAADYRFTFAAADSAGDAYRDDHPWGREDELLCAQHLFVGGGAEPPATSISMEFGSQLWSFPDTRPGRHPRWHKQVDASVVLLIRRPTSDLEVRGDVRFHVVRGDSALIPPDLGVGPDSTRWYIEGIEDHTLPMPGAVSALPGAFAPQPARSTSWGRLRVLYRASEPGAPPAGAR